jgi:hypothetical protein
VTAPTLAVFVLGVALVVAVSLFVAAPLFRPEAAREGGDDGGERERWERQKRQALLAIKEAEMDHRMGKLSDEDLTGMRGRFETQALEAMAALEKLAPAGRGR